MLLALALVVLAIVGVSAAGIDSWVELRDSSDLPAPPAASDLGTLLHVQLIHRHGDRAPVHINPVDHAVWNRAGIRPGQLSQIGVSQLHALGRFLRHTYIHSSFLPLVPGSAVSVRSTDVDRCLQSVHSLLDELYPQSMLPVHTIAEEAEKLLQGTDKCPSYLLTYRGILADMDATLLQELAHLPHPPTDPNAEEHDESEAEPTGEPFNLLAHLAEVSGWGDQLPPSHLLSIVTDNVVCLRAHRLPLPPLLAHSLPLLRNYTKAVLFHKYTPSHVRRAWSLKHGHTFTMPDDHDAGEGMDPRGTVGSVLAKHALRHWRELQTAQRAAAEALAVASGGAKRSLLGVNARKLLPLRSQPSTQPPAAAAAAAPADGKSRIETLAARRRRYKLRKRALLADEKFMIYSAHDTTLLALFEALGLITSPESELLYPPYAASVTFELRQRPSDADAGGDDLFVNAFYGFPLPVAGDPSPTAWEYHRHPLALRCLTAEEAEAEDDETDSELDPDQRPKWMPKKQWQCSLADFTRYVRFVGRSGQARLLPKTTPGLVRDRTVPQLIGAYPRYDGCCEKMPSFFRLGCASQVANTSELEGECLAFRQRCPANACQPGEKLDLATLACEKSCNDADTEVHVTAAIAAERNAAERSADLLVVPSTDGLMPGSSALTPHRDWWFLAFCLACLGGALYSCVRAERARKDMARGGFYRESLNSGMADESESEDDTESLLQGAAPGARAPKSKRKSQSSATIASVL